MRNVARFHTGSDVVAWLRMQLWGSDHGLNGVTLRRPRTDHWICPNPKLGSWTITHVSAYWRKDSVQWSSESGQEYQRFAWLCHLSVARRSFRILWIVCGGQQPKPERRAAFELCPALMQALRFRRSDSGICHEERTLIILLSLFLNPLKSLRKR